ncbi:MAG: hypothetical protein M3Y87_22875 [Myxococcota bacterium]|nr:hypothetical protein [Myxococcota bacterium]
MGNNTTGLAARLGAGTQRMRRGVLVLAALASATGCVEGPSVGVVAAAASESELDAGLTLAQARDEVMTWPYCGAPEIVLTGVPERACAALDGECVIGVLHTSEEDGLCCTSAARPLGVPCAGGEGECNEGKCASLSSEADRDRDGAPDDDDLVVGDETWVRTDLRDLAIFASDTALELRLDGTTWAWLPLEAPLDLSMVRFDRDLQFGVVALSAPVPEVEVLLPRAGTHCLLHGSWGEPEAPHVGVECHRVEGARKISCPGEGDGWSCTEQEDGTHRLRARDFRQTWVPLGGSLGDGSISGVGGIIGAVGGGIPGGVPELRIDRCDGEDEDGDGRVDEGASTWCSDHRACTVDTCVAGECRHTGSPASFCNDGIACTTDSCPNTISALDRENPDFRFDGNGCQHQEWNWRCDDGAACTQDFCGEPPSVGDGDEVVPGTGPDAGCSYVARHDFCADEWDGCTCNGREVCAPSGQSAAQLAETDGCVLAPRLEYPCEEAVGDDNGCTEELCCEDLKTSCRVHQELIGRFPRLAPHADVGRSLCEPEIAALLRADGGEAEAFAGLVSDPETVEIADDTHCGVGGSIRPFPYGYHCEDRNPCTEDEHCIEPSGDCGAELLSGAEVGCEGRVQAGSGDASGEWSFNTCLAWRCHIGTCTPFPDTSCDNGVFCDGSETCSRANVEMNGWVLRAPSGLVDEPAGALGCESDHRACDDRIDCTVDSCDEATRSCSVTPVDVICGDGEWDPCAPHVRCDAEAEVSCPPGAASGSCDVSGCVGIEPRNPCMDGNVCTSDVCWARELDHFECESERTYLCTVLDRDDLFEPSQFELPPPIWRP